MGQDLIGNRPPPLSCRWRWFEAAKATVINMTRQELLQRSSSLLGRFAHEVKVANAMGQFDINVLAEDFFIPILAAVFECPNLRNQNRIQMNFPAVDLGCTSSRTSIQVTSDSSSGKMNETLEKFESHNLSSKFDKLFVYVITERQGLYSSKKLKETVNKFSVKFDASTDILDYRDLAKMLSNLSNEQLERINGHLEVEFGKSDTKLQFRNNLEKFLLTSRQKIEDEKRTRKYISSVFVETTKTKEEMRYFANPMFFYRKIDDNLRHINLEKFNNLLGLAKIEPISRSLEEIENLAEPTDLFELRDRLAQQSGVLEALQLLVSPFSWYGERNGQFEPIDNLSGYWTVFKHGIESSGSGVHKALDDVVSKIRLAQAKIFLVTGMAGQGKTNFVCDLVENQFEVFEVPTIFIPARALNDYSGTNRVLSYINNNRFAPDVTDLHDLFSLLNNVAAECQKPFVIVIDGINEVGDLDGFVAELRVLLEALCQYDFLKILITCRSEFFDHKFAEVFEPQFSGQLHRVQNLRSRMSDQNKSRLLAAYLDHFEIDVRLSNVAKNFLENDLILLRIFCEINGKKKIGYVPDIYKGDIFEDYLMMKIKEFPSSERPSVLSSLYKVCSRMLDDEDFSQIPISGFDETERQTIDRLIGEDIILRREVPSTGLASIGIENISFTYDELRDFLLAYYSVMELAASNPKKIVAIFEKLPDWSIYEGFFRYAYILARKQANDEVLAACEESIDFQKHYLNNLSLLSSDIQTSEDVTKVRFVLANSTDEREVRQVAWFLFWKRELTEHLNIQVLLDHLNSLDDHDSERFLKAMFSRPFDFHDKNLQDKISNLLGRFLKLSDDQKLDLGVSTLAVCLHFAPYAHWDKKEAVFNSFAELQFSQEFSEVIKACRLTVSEKVKSCLDEISKPKEVS